MECPYRLLSNNTQTSNGRGPAVRRREGDGESWVEGRTLPYLSSQTPPLLSPPFLMCPIGDHDVAKWESVILRYPSLLLRALLSSINIMSMTSTLAKFHHNMQLNSKPDRDLYHKLFCLLTTLCP